ncbi:MAG: methyltransferase [Thermodesulfobacteriota bacterium]
MTWNKDTVLELSARFTLSRILISAAEIDLFSKLKDGPKTVEQLCADEGWSERALRILLDALAAQELVRKADDGTYSLDASLVPALTKDSAESILPMLLHRGSMWKTWSNLTEIVKNGKSPDPNAFEARPREQIEAFIGAMHVIGRDLADKIADSVDLSPFTRMIDVGGASGTYTIAFLRKAPHLNATLVDRPEVVEMARTRLAREQLLDRVKLVGLDFQNDPLPAGHDLALVSAIIHQNDSEENRVLYRRIHDCLITGGAILIRDHVMDPSRTTPVDGAVFAVNMLVATPGGNTYTLEEITEDLQSTGFTDVRLIRSGERMDHLVMASKAR